MKTELIIANKSVGKMWEISNSVPEVTWSTERTGSPGTLKFNVLKAGDLSFAEGDIVRFSVDGQLQFYGWDSGHMLRPHPLSEGQRIL